MSQFLHHWIQRARIMHDRRRAIESALALARKGDFVLVAGKGHETYQIFKDRTIHFDDREVVREFLEDPARAKAEG